MFETKETTQTGNEEQVCGSNRSEATLIQLVLSVLDAVAAVDEFDDCDKCNQAPDTVPSFNSVLDVLKTTQALIVDDEQHMAYKIICSTFLLKLISESDDNNNDSDETTNASVMSIVEKSSKRRQDSTEKCHQSLACLWKKDAILHASHQSRWCRQ